MAFVHSGRLSMNKWIWIIIIVVALIIAGFFVFGGDDASPTGDNQETIDTPSDNAGEQTNPLETDNDVFNEIDASLEYLE